MTNKNIRVSASSHKDIVKVSGAIQMITGEIISKDAAIAEMIACFNKMWRTKI